MDDSIFQHYPIDRVVTSLEKYFSDFQERKTMVALERQVYLVSKKGPNK